MTGWLTALVLAAMHLASAPSAAQSVEQWATVVEPEGGVVPRVVIDAPYLTVTIVGADVDSVAFTVRSAESGVPMPRPVRDSGTVRLVDTTNSHAMNVDVSVPHGAQVRVRTSNQGAVTVRDVYGEVEVENSNAPVILEGLRGPTVASTSNAPISATFDRMPSRGLVSLLTSNGLVTVTLPDSARASVVLETDDRVEVDFELTPSAGSEEGPQGGRAVRGDINGGGPLIRVRTDNNAIRLIRSQ